MLCITLKLIQKWKLLLKCWLSGHLLERKNKEKDQSVINKSGCGCLREQPLWELFNDRVSVTIQMGFTMPVVTRARCLQEWSQRELRLYMIFVVKVLAHYMKCLKFVQTCRAQYLNEDVSWSTCKEQFCNIHHFTSWLRHILAQAVTWFLSYKPLWYAHLQIVQENRTRQNW